MSYVFIEIEMFPILLHICNILNTILFAGWISCLFVLQEIYEQGQPYFI